MQISPISLTSFKGNQQVIDLEDNEYQINDIFEEDLQDEFTSSSDESEGLSLEARADKMSKVFTNIEKKVESGDIKGPGAIVAAVGAAAGRTFIKTAKTVLLADIAFKHSLNELSEKGLKQVSKTALNWSEKLANTEIKESAKTASKKFADAKLMLAKGINFAESHAKAIYKKMDNNKLCKPVVFIAGAISTLAYVPVLLKIDGNEDGVADIMQKSQNVYKANNEKCDKIVETIDIAKDTMEILT